MQAIKNGISINSKAALKSTV
jgi:copine 5/8/9